MIANPHLTRDLSKATVGSLFEKPQEWIVCQFQKGVLETVIGENFDEYLQVNGIHMFLEHLSLRLLEFDYVKLDDAFVYVRHLFKVFKIGDYDYADVSKFIIEHLPKLLQWIKMNNHGFISASIIKQFMEEDNTLLIETVENREHVGYFLVIL